MNENYLLHNETAKKLYFEYAKDLPIIALCSDWNFDDVIYNNITEAFLLNDSYKLDAMRDCGIDEKFITGDASDYEKFKAFCSVLPKFAGHPIYLLSHIELKKNFECDLSICEENCEAIWQYCNSKITSELFTDDVVMQKSKLSFVNVFHLVAFNEINNPSVVDLKTLETRLLEIVSNLDKNGCKIAVHPTIDIFEKPNLYKANEIIQKIKREDQVASEDYSHIFMQINRTLGIEYKKRNWSLIWYKEDYWEESNIYNNIKALEYLEKSNALPISYNLLSIYTDDTEKEISERLIRFAKKNILGNFVLEADFISPTTAFARTDYIRRIICNIIGQWVENGEYTSNEKTLKQLIEDILYNNLKEAIS